MLRLKFLLKGLLEAYVSATLIVGFLAWIGCRSGKAVRSTIDEKTETKNDKLALVIGIVLWPFIIPDAIKHTKKN